MTLLINPFLFRERLKNTIFTILKCRPKLEGIVVCVMQNAGVIKFISFVVTKCDMGKYNHGTLSSKMNKNFREIPFVSKNGVVGG